MISTQRITLFSYLCIAMKRLYTFLIILIAICATAIAKPYSVTEVPNVQLANKHRYTSNPDGILSPKAVQAIDLACDSLRTKGIAEIAVVVLRDIASEDVFDFGHKLFSSWGVGSDRLNNGLGIILVLDRREIRFITGDGLEGVLTDAMCKRIQQQHMVSHLGAGDYDKGMVDGVAAVATLLSTGELPVANNEMSREETIALLATTFAFFAIFMAIIFFVYRAAHRCPRCGKYNLKHTNSQILQETNRYRVVAKTFVCPNCGNTFIKNSHIDKTPTIIVGGGGRGGGFGGGGFGGGFGGGSFGGGGAGSRF